jgi:hypothetical protein
MGWRQGSLEREAVDAFFQRLVGFQLGNGLPKSQMFVVPAKAGTQ